MVVGWRMECKAEIILIIIYPLLTHFVPRLLWGSSPSSRRAHGYVSISFARRVTFSRRLHTPHLTLSYYYHYYCIARYHESVCARGNNITSAKLDKREMRMKSSSVLVRRDDKVDVVLVLYTFKSSAYVCMYLYSFLCMKLLESYQGVNSIKQLIVNLNGFNGSGWCACKIWLVKVERKGNITYALQSEGSKRKEFVG